LPSHIFALPYFCRFIELQTRLMERGYWLEEPMKIDADEMIEDSEMLTDLRINFRE
jgi:hypothetical protein